MTEFRCPDCSATAPDGREIRHDDSCPLGIATDAQMEADRTCFEQHPGRTSYRRPICRFEIDELRMIGAVPADVVVYGQVEIVQLAPGLRTRRFDDVRYVRSTS